MGGVILFALPVTLTGLSMQRIAGDPLLRPMVDASIAEIAATSDRMMARETSPERIAARLTELLAQTPRNWLAIQAVEGVAADRGMPLPADLTAQRNQMWDDDSGMIAAVGSCMTCVWDAGTVQSRHLMGWIECESFGF